jgi:hypothetical protein
VLQNITWTSGYTPKTRAFTSRCVSWVRLLTSTWERSTGGINGYECHYNSNHKGASEQSTP